MSRAFLSRQHICLSQLALLLLIHYELFRVLGSFVMKPFLQKHFLALSCKLMLNSFGLPWIAKFAVRLLFCLSYVVMQALDFACFLYSHVSSD